METMVEEFDALVLGAGEAGTIVASRAVAAGKRVALVYTSPYGSTCLNVGCVPSKLGARTIGACVQITTRLALNAD